MKKVILLFASLMLMFVTPFVSAQEDGNRDSEGKIVRGPYETNKFWDNWFIDAQVGAGVYLGGHNNDFGSRITPAFQVGVGKWITPSVGVRGAFFYQDKAKQTIGYNTNQFNYWNLHADFMWNLSNAIGGYKETRVYQVIPFIGAGYSHIVGANYFGGVSHSFSLNAGVINKFRVSNRIDVNLELRGSASAHYADKIDASRTIVDVPVAALVGVTFKLGKTNFKRVKPVDNSALLAAEAALRDKNAELAKANEKNRLLAEEVQNLKAAQATASKDVSYGEIPEEGIVFFELGKSVINKKESNHMDVFAYYVKQCIASGKNVTLVGSADKETGNAKLNMELSRDRVNYIKDQLVKEYKVDGSKLNIKAEGDTNNKFKDRQLDRCVYVRF